MTEIVERLRRLSDTRGNVVTDPLDHAASEAADLLDEAVKALERIKRDATDRSEKVLSRLESIRDEAHYTIARIRGATS